MRPCAHLPPTRLLRWPSAGLGIAIIYLHGRQCPGTGEDSDTAQWLVCSLTLGFTCLACVGMFLWEHWSGNEWEEQHIIVGQVLPSVLSPSRELSQGCLGKPLSASYGTDSLLDSSAGSQ